MTEQQQTVYDRPAVYEEDGKVIYRASALGSCLGALTRYRRGMTGAPPPDLMLERYAEGHAAEADVLLAGLGVDWMEATEPGHLDLYGTRLVDEQTGRVQVESSIEWKDKVVRCHPDAIVVKRHSGEVRVAEVKFLGQEMYDAAVAGLLKSGLAGLRSYYAWQTAVEMHSTGLGMLLILGQKSVIVTTEGERSISLGDVECFEFDEPAYSLTDIKARVAQVEAAARRVEGGGDWPACPVPFDYPCGFWAEHDAPAVDQIEDEVLTNHMLSYLMLKSTADSTLEKAAAIKAEILARMKVLGVTSGVNSGYSLTVTDTRPGNVSWAKAYKALAKQTGTSVAEDEFRGAEVAGGVTLRKVDNA